MSRYDDRYDSFARRTPPMMPGGWYPGAFWGGAPMFGWGGWDVGFPPYLPPMGYGPYRDHTPRHRPESSPAYGAGGDRAIREWAARRGYDAGYAIRPHLEGDRGYGARHRSPPRRYGRDFERGR